MPGTNVYIDGFNLFYGAVKGGPHKWLDLTAPSKKLLRTHQLQDVKYFTAQVDDRPEDPNQSQRQDVYIRALEGSGVQVLEGTSGPARRP